jgi:carbonic anhydrase
LYFYWIFQTSIGVYMNKFRTFSLFLMLFGISIVLSQPPLKAPLNKNVASKSKTQQASKDEQAHTISIDEMILGNENFQNNTRTNVDYSAQRKELVSGQKPNYIVVTCSDSRVCPEIVFDKGLGEVFVVRTAGNIIDSICIGSIEYAAEHLHSSYLIIMGHSSCGAVTAAMGGESDSPYINSMLKYIKPAVQKAQSKKLDKDAALDFAITQNVKNQIDAVRKSSVIKHLEEKGELKILGCVYHLDSGKVEFLN